MMTQHDDPQRDAVYLIRNHISLSHRNDAAFVPPTHVSMQASTQSVVLSGRTDPTVVGHQPVIAPGDARVGDSLCSCCSEHGEDSERALFVADALEYMKRWMCRYATLVRGATLEEVRD
jgi:hypothetical protein